MIVCVGVVGRAICRLGGYWSLACVSVRDPDLGLRYLVQQRFVEYSASSIARFLISRKGLSKLKIGEYLGNLQQRFNMDVLG